MYKRMSKNPALPAKYCHRPSQTSLAHHIRKSVKSMEDSHDFHGIKQWKTWKIPMTSMGETSGKRMGKHTQDWIEQHDVPPCISSKRVIYARRAFRIQRRVLPLPPYLSCCFFPFFFLEKAVNLSICQWMTSSPLTCPLRFSFFPKCLPIRQWAGFFAPWAPCHSHHDTREASHAPWPIVSDMRVKAKRRTSATRGACEEKVKNTLK